MNKWIEIILGTIFVMGCLCIGIGIDVSSATCIAFGIGLTIVGGISAIVYPISFT